MIIGCDFHTRYQQIAMLDDATGELTERRLDHQNGEAEAFYRNLHGAFRTLACPPLAGGPQPRVRGNTSDSTFPSAASTNSPTRAHRITNSPARNAMLKPETTTMTRVTTPPPTAAFSLPTGPPFPLRSPTLTSPIPKPSTSTPWSATTPKPSPTSMAMLTRRQTIRGEAPAPIPVPPSAAKSSNNNRRRVPPPRVRRKILGRAAKPT